MKKFFAFQMLYLIVFISHQIFATDAGELLPVVLPDDEGSHSFNLEWWYYTGHLESLGPGAPRKFAYEMTVFKGEAFKPLTGYVAHFALIDLDEKKHFPFQRINIFASLLPPAPTDQGFKFVFEPGSWLVEGNNGHDRLRAKHREYAIDLMLHALKPPALLGDQGIVDYGTAGKMAYYSRTRMESLGTVSIPDKKGHQKTFRVTGMTWMDHQWGNSGNPTQMGWDWFSIQLKNQIDLMIFQVRNRTSQEILKTTGFVISELGEVSSIPEELIAIETKEPVKLEKVVYPSQWNIKVPAPYDIDLNVKAQFTQQRFKVPAQVTPIYWEGSCVTEGLFRGLPVQGEGFTEMAGYE